MVSWGSDHSIMCHQATGSIILEILLLKGNLIEFLNRRRKLISSDFILFWILKLAQSDIKEIESIDFETSGFIT